MRNGPPTAATAASLARALACAIALALLASMLATPAWAAPTTSALTPVDRVFADLSDDDQLATRDRSALHAAGSMTTFDQYRGNDPDVLATCRGVGVACDVVDDGRLALATTVEAEPVAASLHPAWVGSVSIVLLVALAVPILLLAGRRLLAIGHVVAPIAAIVVVTAWSAAMVLGIRSYAALGGAYVAQYGQDLLLAAALVAQGIVVLATTWLVATGRAKVAGSVRRAIGALASPALVLVACFVAFAWLSRGWAPDPGNADATLATMLGGCSAAVAIAVLAHRRRAVAAWALATTAACAGVGGLVGGVVLPSVSGRMAGIPADPNMLATTFACGAGVALVGVLVARRRALRIGSLAVVVAAIVGVAATQSRGGLLALVVAVVLVAALVDTRRARRGAGIVVVAAIVATLAAPAFTAAGDGSAIARSVGDGASSGRVDTWRNAARQAADRPVAGVGIGGFVPSIDRYRVPGDRSLVQAAHNTPLQVAAELGIVGLVLGTAALVALVVPNLRRARAGDPLAIAWCAAAGAIGSASLLLTTYADPLAWLVVALGAGSIAAGAAEAGASDEDDGDATAEVVDLRALEATTAADDDWTQEAAAA